MHWVCSTFHNPDRLETLFPCHDWERGSYWIEHHTERLWDNALLRRSLDFSVEQDCSCFTFHFDLASLSSVIHLLCSYVISENILNICLLNGFLLRFSFCSPSSSFLPQTFHLFSTRDETPFLIKIYFVWKYSTYLKNIDLMLVNVFCQRTFSLKLHCSHSLYGFFILLGLVWKVLGFFEADRRDH